MSSKRSRPGRTVSLGPPEGQPFIWMTKNMLGSITHLALGIHARRILDFLLYEHMAHGGKENGNLAAPYKQLEVWGLTSADVRKGFEELFVTGFVRLTKQGLRTQGRGEPARYALTWLPTMVGALEQAAPTHDWQDVLEKLERERVGSVIQARAWLREQTANHRRGRKQKRATTPQMSVVSPLNREAA